MYFRVLNRDVSRSQDKAPPLRSFFGNKTFKELSGWGRQLLQLKKGSMAQLHGGSPEMEKCVCVCVVGADLQGGRGLCPPTSAGTQVGGYLKDGRLDTTHSCFESLGGAPWITCGQWRGEFSTKKPLHGPSRTFLDWQKG